MLLGQLVEIDDSNALLPHPAHPYTESFVSDVHMRRITLKGDEPDPAESTCGSFISLEFCGRGVSRCET